MQDVRCSICGKSIKELEPFEDGSYLKKIYRPMLTMNILKEKYPKLNSCLDKNGMVDEKKFIKEYGEKELGNLMFALQLVATIESSWECKDCISLSDDEALRTRFERAKKEVLGNEQA